MQYKKPKMEWELLDDDDDVVTHSGIYDGGDIENEEDDWGDIF